MKRNPLTLIIAGLVVIVFGLWLIMFQVRKSEVAVVTLFGKPTRDITQPGPHLKLPPPIEIVHRFDQRVQNFEDKLTEGQTLDKLNLLTSVYVGWKITEPKDFLPKFAGSQNPIAEAERVLERLLSNAKTAVVGKHPLSDFISISDDGKGFLTIENEILAALQAQVQSEKYGLEIEFLGIKKLQLPESVTQAVFDKMTAERKVLTEKSQNEGEAEAQKIRAEADRKAAEVLADADSKATGIRAQGEAEAAKYLSVFQQNPDLANFIFKLYALENSFKDRSTLVVDPNVEPFDLLLGVPKSLRKP
jgi:membrane protease subunit HflC